MTRRSLLPAVLVVIVAVGALPEGASAAKVPVCGTKDSDGNTILGSLAVNESSTTTKSYGTERGDRRLALLYDVTGCTLPPTTRIAPGQVSVLPPTTGEDLPGEPIVTVTVEKPDPVAVAASIALKLDGIAPGTRGGIVRVHVPGLLHDSLTPISVSRTGSWYWAVLLGLGGALAGVGWAVALHFAESIDVKLSLGQGVLVCLLGLGAGLAAGYGYWHNQEVWTLGDNGWPTLVSGFTASTTGALAGVTAALFAPSKDQTDAAEGGGSKPRSPETGDEDATGAAAGNGDHPGRSQGVSPGT